MSSRSTELETGLKGRRAGKALAVVAALVVVLGACSSDDGNSTDATRGQGSNDQQQTIDSLNDEVAAQTKRADDAEAALKVAAEQFPVKVTASLAEFDLIGAYTMTLTEAYCDGLPTCGATRPPIRVDIVQGSNGLELKIPNVLTAGLFAINGTLFAVTDSDLILDPCGATPRVSRVSTTLFADGISIESDGTRTLTGLGASLLVSADAVDTCAAGVVFWAATLTPV